MPFPEPIWQGLISMILRVDATLMEHLLQGLVWYTVVLMYIKHSTSIQSTGANIPHTLHLSFLQVIIFYIPISYTCLFVVINGVNLPKHCQCLLGIKLIMHNVASLTPNMPNVATFSRAFHQTFYFAKLSIFTQLSTFCKILQNSAPMMLHYASFWYILQNFD